MSETKTASKNEKKSEDPRVTGKPVIVEEALPEPAQEEIAALAYQIWIERGSPHGSHEEDWYHAEQQLRAEKPKTKSASA